MGEYVDHCVVLFSENKYDDDDLCDRQLNYFTCVSSFDVQLPTKYNRPAATSPSRVVQSIVMSVSGRLSVGSHI